MCLNLVEHDWANSDINRIQFTVINGEGKSEEFVRHLEEATKVMRDIITASAI